MEFILRVENAGFKITRLLLQFRFLRVVLSACIVVVVVVAVVIVVVLPLDRVSESTGQHVPRRRVQWEEPREVFCSFPPRFF